MHGGKQQAKAHNGNADAKEDPVPVSLFLVLLVIPSEKLTIPHNF
jgi:hypothetical protein